MVIDQYISKVPRIADSVFIAEGAVILGDVEIGHDCSVWFNAVIRGDVNYIRIGQRTNIQDGVIVHGTLNKFSANIGDDVSVGHGAILHGCTIEDEVLIGMGAKILDRAIVHRHSIIAAGAVIREGFEVPPNTLMAGVPAKPVRQVTAEEIEMIKRIPQNYIRYADDYRTIRPVIVTNPTREIV